MAGSTRINVSKALHIQNLILFSINHMDYKSKLDSLVYFVQFITSQKSSTRIRHAN
ncbi:protein of unknown function [Xenorhabdus doucetiae]|uniref:Uncharacterized protein n=1 Tax=Xenorhabdus doucetiae TaxID=351671 RepID=A0A068QWA2_9GAMM|nr:protein of unknown function [Xenorhabdus doucetiae]